MKAAASAQAAEGDDVGGAAPGPEHAGAVVAVVVDHGGAAGLLGFEPDLRSARAQPDLDAQDRRRGQLRNRDRRPVDGLRRDPPVRHQQVAAGPPDPAEEYAPAVRHDADAVRRRAALEYELVHERRADQHVLTPHGSTLSSPASCLAPSPEQLTTTSAPAPASPRLVT